MNKILEFLEEAGIFYFATTEDSQPHVRAFGFVMEHNDRLYFGIGNHKPCYEQLKSNPRFELCAYDKENDISMRLTGVIEFDNAYETIQYVFQHSHFLSKLYGDPAGPQFVPFYVKNGEAVFETQQGEKWSEYI